MNGPFHPVSAEVQMITNGFATYCVDDQVFSYW